MSHLAFARCVIVNDHFSAAILLQSILLFYFLLVMHEVANMRIADDLKNVYGSKKVVTLSLIVNDSHQSLRELRQALKHRSLWMFSYSFLFTSMICLTSKSLKTEVHISSESSALFSDKSFASLVYLLRGFRLTKYLSFFLQNKRQIVLCSVLISSLSVFTLQKGFSTFFVSHRLQSIQLLQSHAKI